MTSKTHDAPRWGPGAGGPQATNYDRDRTGRDPGARLDTEPHRASQPKPVVLGDRGVVRGHVVEAVAVLRSRLAESWTLNSLAEEVHLSRSQLVRCFDATVKMSPMSYLRQMRVERMARLLVSTDSSIAEAARAVGWSDQFHASRCFHAQYGVSPTEYRRRQRPLPLG